MTTIEFRTANEGDADQLEALEARAWTKETSPSPAYEGPIFGGRLPFADVIVACRGEVVLGYIAIGRRTAFASNAHVASIRSIVVSPEHARAGLGRQLLNEAEKEARRRGFRALRLNVMGSNIAARALYVSAGFAELGRYPAEFRVEDEWIDDVFMGKAL